MNADNLTTFLGSLSSRDLGAATVNKHRNSAVAFGNWCVQTLRLESNPLALAVKLDENRDRRRVRRPLTDDELATLIEVAGDKDEGRRRLWYMAATLGGLRKGDMQRLRWSDIDFEAETVTISGGKAKRTDIVPLHRQLLAELRSVQSAVLATPGARVFPTTPSEQTRHRDFVKAGLGRIEPALNADGQPVFRMIGGQRRAVTRFSAEDADGRVVDLHAMRLTLGTALATPQASQRILRHSDYRTTPAALHRPESARHGFCDGPGSQYQDRSRSCPADRHRRR